MKKVVVLSVLPLIVMARTVSFSEAINLATTNNKELLAKQRDIEIAQLIVKEPDAYKKGKLKFAENISRTNHAGYVFGMKLASREANFGDFGFSDFLGGIAGAMNYTQGDYGKFKNMMTNPQTQKQMLATQPNDLNYPDARNNFETKLTYEVPLFTGYKLENAKTMALLQLKAKQAKLSHDRKALGLEVIKAYNGAATAKKFIALTKEAAKIAKRFKNTAIDMYNKGITRMVDVNQASMAEYSIKTKTKEANTQFRLAIAYLKFLTNDKSITDVRGFRNPKIPSKNLKTLQANAMVNRDDLKWMKKNVETMKTKIAYDSADEYPTVGAHIEYGTNDDRFTVNTNKDYYLVAVGLKKTLYNGELTKIAKQKAKIEHLKTLQYEEYMRDGIKLEVEKNYLDYMTQKKTLIEKRKTVKMAKSILDETEDIFKNNFQYRTNMMYLLLSLGKYMEAKADVITSTYNKSISAASLKLSIGNSL